MTVQSVRGQPGLASWTVRMVRQFPGLDAADIVQWLIERTGSGLCDRDLVLVHQTYVQTKREAWTPLRWNRGAP